MASSGFSTLPMLASLSVVAPDVEGDCQTADQPVFIKNTFVYVFDDHLASIAIQRRPRSNSAPPACRTPCDAPRQEAYDLDNSVPENVKCIPCGSTSPYAMSLASTSAMEDSDGEIVSFMGSIDDESSDDDPAPAATHSEASATVVPLRLSELLPSRTALKTSAKAWRSQTSETRLAFAEVVAAGQSSLMVSSGLTKVHTSENSSGWSLAAGVQGTEYSKVEGALADAGEAMLAAAGSSQNVYVVGYDHEPFKPLHNGLGFRAQLAVVHDEALACWDLLAKGVCSRGCACKWQHPTFTTNVTVSLEAVPPLPV